MTSMAQQHRRRRVIVGLDTHKFTHVAVALDADGAVLDSRSVTADSAGYEELIGWARKLGQQVVFAVEGTGSYGAGVSVAIRRHGLEVIEVSRTDRRDRRLRGKSDTLDAENAARAVLAGRATSVPKAADGTVGMIRQIEEKVVNRLRQVTSAIRQDGANRVNIIASTAEMLTSANWIHWDPQREEFVTSSLPLELQQQVFSKRYPMPMLSAPKVLEEEQDSPYLTESKSQSVLGEYSGQRTNLVTLNVLNGIRLRINPAVKQQAPDPFKDDDKFRKDSAAVFDRIADKDFHLTWQFDFRGRVYARGYHVNPQGDDWHKHVIQFA